ncbi:trans-aconitate 2-methyltransferase [Rhodococcus sp. 27YEA15]|uniref:trans-aconitate 2-methyltransferase n=1 Tax=Rhodococcus sp. 27YEA15 TaxID=3156259 RepID=UPI003C7E6741
MATVTWNPDVYGRYADERARPFVDLITRVGAAEPDRVADLGCGSGALTALLGERWPGSSVTGFDSSPQMVAEAPSGLPANVSVELGDIDSFQSTGFDVIVSNAALQWVPRHRELIDQWAAAMTPGSWIAWQVPGNFSAPSHALMRTLASSPRWNTRVGSLLRGAEGVDGPAEYALRLQAAGFDVDAWETTYVHVLPGADPVLEWVRGTALRPVLDVLGDAESHEFESEYAAMLREAYPPTSAGTLFPFRRVFCVGRKQ